MHQSIVIMRYDDFIQQVRRRTDLESDDRAVEVTHAVLGTLGECLYRTERDKLAAELPKELKAVFFAERSPENRRQDVERYRLEEFFNRVRARADTGGRETETCTGAVFSVLREAVSAGTMDAVLNALPDEYDALLRTGA